MKRVNGLVGTGPRPSPKRSVKYAFRKFTDMATAVWLQKAAEIESGMESPPAPLAIGKCCCSTEARRVHGQTGRSRPGPWACPPC